MKLIPTALALALSVNYAQATESWFEVELILFERHGEKTAQQLHLAPRTFDQHNRIDLITQQIAPQYEQCPKLSQEQRHSLEQQAALAVDLDPVEQLEPALDDTALIAQEPIKCQAPDETLLAQAYLIRQQRLKDQEPAIEELSLETQPQQAQLPESDLIAYDPLVYIPYPTTLKQNGIEYQVFPYSPATAIDAVPVTLKSEELADKLETPHLLPLDNLQLVELRKKMRWQKSLTPILHTGWRQPVYARHLAQPFYLFGGENYAENYNIDGSQITLPDADVATLVPELETTMIVGEKTATGESVESLAQQLINSPNSAVEIEIANQPSVVLDQIISELEAEIEQTIPPLWQLDGLLKIYLNRFLFIEADFDLRKPGLALRPSNEQLMVDNDAFAYDGFNSQQSSMDGSISLIQQPQAVQSEAQLEQTGDAAMVEVPWLQSSQLVQNRRVRSKEIHYFDHPNFGLVIQIRRFKLETEQINQEE